MVRKVSSQQGKGDMCIILPMTGCTAAQMITLHNTLL